MKKQLYIYFASSNKDKLREIKSILRAQRSEVRGQRSEVRGQRSEVRGQRSEVRGQKRIIVKSAPKGFHVIETGKTFLENAYKKASTLSKKLNVYAFSDDSGIEVFSLGRKPGVMSSRFFRNGKGMFKIIKKIKNKKNRKCCFTCAIVLTNPQGKIIFKTQKSWFGKIGYTPLGKNGFGYDPIFIVPGLNKTSAEISPKLKNKLSHRGMAIRAFAKWLQKPHKKLTLVKHYCS